MNWIRESDYHMVSEDRRYTIPKYAIKGVWFYELWRGRECISTRLPSADCAKAICTQQEAA